MRPMCAVPRRNGPSGGGPPASGEQRQRCRRRPRTPRGVGSGHARRVHLRSRPDRFERSRIRHRPTRGFLVTESVPVGAPRRLVELTVDGEVVRAPEGSTILGVCRSLGREIPTLCYGDTLTPKNACRVCMVELEGSRVLVPACSRKVEAGMVVHTDTERARHSRRLVLELLGSTVDLTIAPDVARWNEEYAAAPDRFG